MTGVVGISERIVRLEESVSHLRTDVSELKEQQKNINEKLDDLIAIKQKGAGVFWLLSTIMGEVGLVGLAFFIVEHLRK